jgi:hypothetical protein
MSLPKLPSIISETEFDRRGFAVSEKGLLVPAYMASQLGFSELKSFLYTFYDRLRNEAGILPLCPFTACGEYLNFSELAKARTQEEVIEFWNRFNKLVGPVNYGQLMPKSKLMIAILDGGHAVDDGVAAEIGYYAVTYQGKMPIFGIRSDFRLAENPAAQINPAVRYFLDEGPYNGQLFTGLDAYNKAVKKIAEFAGKLRRESETKS